MMIHWENGPNDRGQAFLIGGVFNSQTYMAGEVAIVFTAIRELILQTRSAALTLQTRSAELLPQKGR